MTTIGGITLPDPSVDPEVEAMELFVRFVRDEGGRIRNPVLLVKIWHAYLDAYREIGPG